MGVKGLDVPKLPLKILGCLVVYTFKLAKGFLDCSVNQLREASELKNVTKSGKSPKGGGWVRTKNQKVQNSKFGLFDKRGGRLYFHFFPKCRYRL